jgi:signal transduction histidine kinase
MKNRRQALLSWLFVAAVIGGAVSLGVLQYRWIGEVSVAERERLRSSLQVSLNRLSLDFNQELTSACLSMLPDRAIGDPNERRQEYAARYSNWRESSRRNRLVRTVHVVAMENRSMKLYRLDDSAAEAVPVEWPASWAAIRDAMLARFSPPDFERRGPGPVFEDSPNVISVPYFGREGKDPRQAWRELDALLVEIDLDYVRQTLIPELLQRDLGGTSDYQAEIVARDDSSSIIFATNPGSRIGNRADASVHLFELRMDVIFRRLGAIGMGFARGGLRGGPGGGGPPREGFRGTRRREMEMPGFDRGRWVLSVRHRSGSLEAAVDRARMRNLAVTSGLLLLMIAAVAALVQFTRRAQKLAHLQMEFVAGVSHELRTPLSVMRTAGHNLQGRVSTDPARVQRYGSLIEQESEKLTAMVEQVLRFANANAGRVIGSQEPVRVADLIDEAIDADRRLIEESQCQVEKNIDPDLPSVLADATSLKHALQNLIGNAAKYGKSGGWIGITATTADSAVEIRIADRGPGVSDEDAAQIFDPFYRGKKAVQDQVHGTGLGLSLAKRIAEAHGGTLALRSEPGLGAVFVMRIPAAVEQNHELAHTPG